MRYVLPICSTTISLSNKPSPTHLFNLHVDAFSLPTEQTHFLHLITSLPMVYSRMIGHITSTSDIRNLAHAIQKGKIMGVGSASVSRMEAAHAYVLKSILPGFSMHGVAPLDCVYEGITSNRG